MQKFLKHFLTLVILACCVFCLYSCGTQTKKSGDDIKQDTNPQGLNFTLKKDDSYYVSIGDAYTLPKIVIPKTFNGKPVTEIITDDRPNDKVCVAKEIILPEGLTAIGECAFKRCIYLRSIVIPDSVKLIGDSAFRECFSLNSVTVGKNVESIGGLAFFDCHTLVEIINFSKLDAHAGSADNGYLANYAFKVKTEGISDVVNKDGYAFYSFGNFNYLLGYGGEEIDLTFPKDYNGQFYNIVKYAFYYNDSIRTITIDGKVDYVDSYAFSFCPNLYKVNVGGSLTLIGYYAFASCYNLCSVSIGENVNKICDLAFEYCYSLVEVINLSSLDITEISYGLTALTVKKTGESEVVNKNGYLFYAYEGENYLLGCALGESSLILPENFNGEKYSVYKYAFRNNNKLDAITVGVKVKSIGEYAFYRCSNLKVLIYNGTMAEWNAMKNDSLWKNNSSIEAIICLDGKVTL